MAILPASVSTAMKLGGYLDLIEKEPAEKEEWNKKPKRNKNKKKVSFNAEDIVKEHGKAEESLRAQKESNNKMIAALSKNKGTLIRGVVDSGAADHVTNKNVAPQVPIKETPAVGIKYTVANGNNVYNQGQKDVCGFTANGNPIELGFQVTDVAKTLFSVKKMKDSGNIVIFGADEGDMIIINPRDCERPSLTRARNLYSTSMFQVMEVKNPRTRHQIIRRNPPVAEDAVTRSALDARQPREDFGIP